MRDRVPRRYPQTGKHASSRCQLHLWVLVSKQVMDGAEGQQEQLGDAVDEHDGDNGEQRQNSISHADTPGGVSTAGRPRHSLEAGTPNLAKS